MNKGVDYNKIIDQDYSDIDSVEDAFDGGNIDADNYIELHEYKLLEPDRIRSFFYENTQTLASVKFEKTHKALISLDTVTEMRSDITKNNTRNKVKENKVFIALIKIPDIDLQNSFFTFERITGGEQEIYYGTEAKEAEDGLLEIRFVNINFTSKPENSSFTIYEEMFWPKVNELELGLETTSLINNIQAKSRPNINSNNPNILDSEQDISVNEKLIPIKMTPIDVQSGKVTMFSDWFDYDVVMPEFIASQFATDAGADLGSISSLSPEEVDLIIDMLTMTYLFATNFTDIPKYTAAEADAAGSGVREGDIKPDQLLGSRSIPIPTLFNLRATDAVNNLFHTYKRKHPGFEKTLGGQITKSIIVALSQYISSNWSIAKGENSFNEVYLPWTLELISPMTVVESNNVWSIPKSSKFVLRSNYFDRLNGNIILKTVTDISSVRIVQSDRKLTLPRLSDTLQIVNKLPLASDISTNTNDDLLYFWYIPDQNLVDFNKIFLNNPTATVDNAQVSKTFDTAAYNVGEKIPDIPAFIRQQAADIFSVDPTAITIISNGTLASRKNPTRRNLDTDSFRPNIYNYPGVYSLGEFDQKYGTDYFTQHVGNEIRLSPGDSAKWIADILGLDPADIIDASQVLFQFVNTGTGTPGFFGVNNQTLHFNYAEYYITAAQININGVTTIISADRDMLYDKPKWKNFIKNFLGLPEKYHYYSFTSDYGDDEDIVSEIAINQIWGDSLKLRWGDDEITVNLLNTQNETDTKTGVLLI